MDKMACSPRTDLYKGLVPEKFFYSRPFPFQPLPEGYYRSPFTYQYLDDYGGLLPDIEVILEIDWFAFLLGGAVTLGYSYYSGEITRPYTWRWPPATDWREDFFPFTRIWDLGVISFIATSQYIGRFIYGGFLYLAIRSLTHATWYALGRTCDVGASFRVMWTAGSIYTIAWASYYTEAPVAWNVVVGCWVGLGLTFIENTWEIFYTVISTLSMDEQAHLL